MTPQYSSVALCALYAEKLGCANERIYNLERDLRSSQTQLHWMHLRLRQVATGEPVETTEANYAPSSYSMALDHRTDYRTSVEIAVERLCGLYSGLYNQPTAQPPTTTDATTSPPSPPLTDVYNKRGYTSKIMVSHFSNSS